MDYDRLNIESERMIRAELYDLFEGDIVETIIRKGKVEQDFNFYKISHEGHSFRISQELAPDLDRLCSEVKASLDFSEPVDFFITNSSEANAYAVPRIGDDDTHLVVLHSRIVDQFDDDELRFVVGHELGHLISDNARFIRIINFVFPDYTQIPVVFRHKISLWKKLSELTADRYGFIASPDLKTCVSNFFKLASGLHTDRIRFVHERYIREMEELIERFRKNPFADRSSHPVNPIRIKALQHFSESRLYREIKTQPSDEAVAELNQAIEELIELLMILGASELDQQRAYFLASAGFVAASVDTEISRAEIELLVRHLSNFTMFPKKFLDALFTSRQVETRFQESTQAILKVNPSERYAMFSFLVSMTLADRVIRDEEVEFLYATGKGLFQMSEKEISQIIGSSIQKEFQPWLFR